MAAVKIYDPDQVVISFASQPLTGFADGTFITVTTEPRFTTKMGADGNVTRTKMGNKVTRVELTLMQTSDSNDFLTALHALDDQEPNGAGVAPIGIADKAGRFLFMSPEAWIIGPPNAEFGVEAGPRVWMFDCNDPQRFDGGS